MKPRRSALLVAALLLSTSTSPVSAKQLPPAFGTELKPENQAREADEPTGAAEIEGRKQKSERPPRYRPQRVGKGGKVKIRLDGDEDGGGSEFGSDAGSDPDAGDF
jgi:hypothetical protein